MSKDRRLNIHANRVTMTIVRLAMYSSVCGIFFIIGLEIGQHEFKRDFLPNASSLMSSFDLEYFWRDNNSHNNQIGPGVLPMPNRMRNPGEMGKPYEPDPHTLTEDQKNLIKEGWKNNGFNQYVSDQISLERELPDARHPKCKEPDRYLKSLPKTSVIIIFHNEAWTPLLRSVHSVINRSPPELIKEIILVDDCSTHEHLKTQLDEYMKRFPKVKIVRAPTRVGLIRARLLGADVAKGKVLTFLDSHIEASPGWLPPLLDRIGRNMTTVVSPIIDAINDRTFEFMYNKSPPGTETRNVGVFEWGLNHNWEAISEREKKKHNDTDEPYASPTMAGGLFSISKRYFEYLGRYDPGFDIWGGENLELSFKIWMCGGSLEMVPCSHVGHIFRSYVPYKGREGVQYVRNNLVRLAKVWLDEYAEIYFKRIQNELGDYGDISERVALRRRLNCKSFRWYLENVYPEIFMAQSGYAYGEIRNVAFGNNTCLDAFMSTKDANKPIGLYPCHRQGGNQLWSFSRSFEIRRDNMCVDYPGGKSIIAYGCHGQGGNQQWSYKTTTQQIVHSLSKKCMTIESTTNLTMAACDDNIVEQKWQLEGYREKLKDDPYAV